MDIEYTCEGDKLKDWLANEREHILNVLCEKVEEFRTKPSYQTTEVLVSLTTVNDLNQSIGRGLFRVTQCEVWAH